MELKLERNDWMFFLLCLIVAIVAEETFFMHHPIGISYFIFIAVFYMLFFWRFRFFSFYTSKTWLSFINSYLDFSSRVLLV